MKKLLKNGAVLAACLIVLLSFSVSFADEETITTGNAPSRPYDISGVTTEYTPKSKMWVDCLSWNTIQYGKYGEVHSLYSVDDVIWAIKTALTHIPAQSNSTSLSAVYTLPATALREAADAIEKQESDIARIKKILEALER